MLGTITLIKLKATKVWYVSLCVYFCTIQSEITAATAISPTVSVSSEITNENM